MIYDNGYVPIVRPNSGRYRGYWRRSRALFEILGDNYRLRWRGESPFGSIINKYGDRLKTIRKDTTAVRAISRLIAHITRIYLRITKAIKEFLDTLRRKRD